MKEKCPFEPDNEIITDMSKVASVSSGEFIDGDGVVNESKNVVFVQNERDTKKFVKLFDVMVFTKLSKAACALLCYALKNLGYDGKAVLSQKSFSKLNRYKTSHTFYNAVEELKNMNILKSSSVNGVYWINPNIACKGDRTKVFDVQNRKNDEME